MSGERDSNKPRPKWKPRRSPSQQQLMAKRRRLVAIDANAGGILEQAREVSYAKRRN